MTCGLLWREKALQLLVHNMLRIVSFLSYYIVYISFFARGTWVGLVDWSWNIWSILAWCVLLRRLYNTNLL